MPFQLCVNVSQTDRSLIVWFWPTAIDCQTRGWSITIIIFGCGLSVRRPIRPKTVFSSRTQSPFVEVTREGRRAEGPNEPRAKTAAFSFYVSFFRGWGKKEASLIAAPTVLSGRILRMVKISRSGLSWWECNIFFTLRFMIKWLSFIHNTRFPLKIHFEQPPQKKSVTANVRGHTKSFHEEAEFQPI